MSDYISREALLDRLNKNLSACNPGTFSKMCYADAIETVKHFPAADVELVRRGRWVNKKGGFFGTLAEFREKVGKTHGENVHAQAYLLAAQLAELRIDTTPVDDGQE